MNKTLEDVLNPARPAGAYDDLLAEVLPIASTRRAWQPSDGALPALFVSHGAPPTLDDRARLRHLFDWGQSLPQPRGIVILSAPWEDAPLAITSRPLGAAAAHSGCCGRRESPTHDGDRPRSPVELHPIDPGRVT